MNWPVFFGALGVLGVTFGWIGLGWNLAGLVDDWYGTGWGTSAWVGWLVLTFAILAGLFA